MKGSPEKWRLCQEPSVRDPGIQFVRHLQLPIERSGIRGPFWRILPNPREGKGRPRAVERPRSLDQCLRRGAESEACSLLSDILGEPTKYRPSSV